MGRYEVFSGLTNTFHGLLELEASLPPSMTHPRVTRPPKRRHPRGTRDHRDDRYQVKLESILAQAKLPPNPAPLNPLRLLERIPTPPTRGPVGSVPVQAAGADEREQGVILLQRLLRGRAEQAAMDRGRTARQELIDELRTTHALEHAEQEIKAQEVCVCASSFVCLCVRVCLCVCAWEVRVHGCLSIQECVCVCMPCVVACVCFFACLAASASVCVPFGVTLIHTMVACLCPLPSACISIVVIQVC